MYFMLIKTNEGTYCLYVKRYFCISIIWVKINLLLKSTSNIADNHLNADISVYIMFVF